ncbi:hypothetical protein Pfo_012292 [Paulownia fortunei]|nr:hypothetical protein Pfo_012292 [Paulownia fortunei]
MMRKVLLATQSNLTAALNLAIFRRHSGPSFQYTLRRFFSDKAVSSDSPPQTRVSELPRVHSLVDGCDYKHWLVVMHPPENYPQREEIIQHYIATLAMALGSEKAAMESMYSVSTKYYYAFSCKVSENVTHKIKSLPRVKWVLPDSYLCTEESGYGNHMLMEKLFLTKRSIMLTGCVMAMMSSIWKELVQGSLEGEEEVHEISMQQVIELMALCR